MFATLRRAGLLALMLGTLGGAAAAPFEQSWPAPKYTLCEGVGVQGSFRVYVSGAADQATGAGKPVRRLAAHVSSGAFTQFEGALSARVFVKVGGKEAQGVTLVRPAGSVIEPAPQPDESRRLYLPSGASLVVPPNGELWIGVTPTVKADSGNCVLGSFEHKIDLP